MTLSVEAISVTKTDNPDGALEALKKKAPFAEEIVTTFGRLAFKRAECKAALDQQEPLDISCDPEQFAQGRPLLPSLFISGSRGSIQQSAACMLLEMERLFPSIAPVLASLRTTFQDAPQSLERLLDALIARDDDSLASLASELDSPLEVLVFAGREIVKPCLERRVQTLAPLIAEMPWSKGYCPICGSQPDLAFLRPKEAESSEYLISKSGQFWLHCSLCTHRWRFVRAKCTYCETTDHKKLEYFSSSNHEDERIYACNLCKHYIPCVDLTNRKSATDLGMEALVLIHLDVLAQKKGFKPLARLPWNQFSDTQQSA
ncbi:MAG TPA: formate dehydrogenase accessory protein FdhE [Desulfonatronum sp.]|nr:formate dehydrogenase accessory protein FdhE [Desulfonatronum sp.]